MQCIYSSVNSKTLTSPFMLYQYLQGPRAPITETKLSFTLQNAQRKVTRFTEAAVPRLERCFCAFAAWMAEEKIIGVASCLNM